MTAIEVGVEQFISSAARCHADGCPDLAIDYYLLAYRQAVRDIVAKMHEYDCPEIPFGPRWAVNAAWIDWASLSLYRRAVRENHEGLEFFDDLAPRSDDLVLYGRYWVDKMTCRGQTVRVIMPDAYCHILVKLATRAVYTSIFPALIDGLLDLGRWSEAKRHAEDHGVLLRWREKLAVR